MTFKYEANGPVNSEFRPLPLNRFRAATKAFADLARPAGRSTDPWADDLFTLAKSVYLADRTAQRSFSADGWTRHIEMRVPMRHADRWTPMVLATLHELLTLLTSDRWTVMPVHDTRHYTIEDAALPARADEVALFSGGLDSTAYAAQCAAEADRCTTFVGYYHPKLSSRIKEVFSRFHCTSLYRGALQPIKGGDDITSRSRGLLYVGTAVWVASAYRAKRVVVPENGQLALNPPLSPARAAACSTRSVHPRTMTLLNDLLTAIGSEVTIVNPFAEKTKGEVCRLALDSGADPETLFKTVSCGHPPMERPGSTLAHCGRCFPCLVRRSGLRYALGYDDSDYQIRDYAVSKHADVLALRRWLGRPFSPVDLLADVQLPRETNVFDAHRMITRGRRELAALFGTLPAGHPMHLTHAA